MRTPSTDGIYGDKPGAPKTGIPLVFSTSASTEGSDAIFDTGMKTKLPALEGVKSEGRIEKVYKPYNQQKWKTSSRNRLRLE